MSATAMSAVWYTRLINGAEPLCEPPFNFRLMSLLVSIVLHGCWSEKRVRVRIKQCVTFHSARKKSRRNTQSMELFQKEITYSTSCCVQLLWRMYGVCCTDCCISCHLLLAGKYTVHNHRNILMSNSCCSYAKVKEQRASNVMFNVSYTVSGIWYAFPYGKTCPCNSNTLHSL